MNEATFRVEGMSCQKCVQKISQAIVAADPTAEIDIDLDTQTVMTESAISAAEIKTLIENAGYTVIA